MLTVLADALTAASVIRANSIIFSEGPFVDWIINTSCPLTFSSYFTHISPSENVLIEISPNWQSAEIAIFFANSGLLLPLNILRSLFI